MKNGPGATNDDGKLIDWTFSPVNPRSYYSYNNFRWGGEPITLPPLEIIVYIGGGGRVAWDKVVVPAGIEVMDERSSVSSARPAGGGRLVVSVYEKHEGKPVAGARVFVFPSKGDEEADTIPIFATDEDGALEIKKLSNDRYSVHVEADGHVSYDAGSYSHDGQNQESKTVYLGKAVTVAGTVIDSNGRPAAGVRVHPHSPMGIDCHPYPMAREIDPVTTDKEGRFKVTELPEGKISISIDRGSGWYSLSSEESPAPAADMRVMVGRTGTVMGIVLDKEGNPVRGSERVLLAQRGDLLDRFYAGTEIQEDGSFELLHLPAGEYLVGQNKGCLYDGTDPSAQVVLVKDNGVVNVQLRFPIAPKENGDREKESSGPVRLVGKDAPELAIEAWLRGEATTLKALKGRIAVLVFWDYRARSCEALVSALNRLATSGTEVVAIQRANADPGALQSYLDSHSAKYRVAEDSSDKAERRGPTFVKYGVRAVPVVFIVGADGKVQYQDIPVAALEKALSNLDDSVRPVDD